MVAAMGPESRILVDEVVLPEFGVHWHAAMQDISMAIQLGRKERTRTQWEKLVEQADLIIAEIRTHDISLYYSIIVLEQK
jgi:demethylsterigmatocystin 6-O-methyltransferase